MSGSVSASASKVNSDYASVNEQSAIRAGDQGFQVNAQGDTDLKGGAITSTQQAINDQLNRFATGGALTTRDIQNQASYSAKSASVNMGTGFSPSGALTPGGTSMGFGKDSGSASSTTRAAISGIAGNANARTGDKETGVAKIFDAAKVQKEIEAQTKITQMFGQLASKAVGDYATSKLKEAATLRDQAAREPDDARAQQLKAQAAEIDSQWGKQGTLRLAAHTVIGGLTGGGSGAAGAAAGTITAPLVAEQLDKAGITGNLATTLTALASTTVGAAVGGTAGAGAAFNEVANNFLTHAESSRRLRLRAEQLACNDDACRAEKQGEIDRLNVLDAWRDQQIEQACRVPSSPGCQAWTAAIQVAARSYSGKSTGIYLDAAERSSVLNKAFEYQQAANNPYLNGVGKGLLKLTPAGMAAGAVGSISALVESLVENGASQTLINVANGIKDFPADLKARLNSPDPTVRGEALVDVVALGAAGTALTAGASKYALDSVQRAAVTKALAGAEEEAIARAKVVNDFYKEGASSNPPGLYTPSGIIPANAEKTTTVLGRWQSDMQSIIDGQIRAPKSDDFGVAPGGFNVLNVSHATEDAAGVHFFERINKPFLDQALKRGDDIALGTIPQRFDDVLYSNGQLKGNFAKELDYLVKNNYKPVNITSAQWETIKGWFK
ncbi:MAG: hypothetical protein IPN64_04535 [Propionivibrio sp.]|uniref:DUF6862 domain-containing protein n=1 Tax=Propionivibrio sp. TaxID=2212460 RepID=UPI0025CEFF73|nr:hypothetical protein [Propionivibrio sp.]MBK8893333.1 hypothetical protein [Propionivibrio sp.]